MITPELREIADRARAMLQKAYGRPNRTLAGALLKVGDTDLKLDYGVLSVVVHHGPGTHLVYVETPSGDYVDPPGDWHAPGAVRHALEELRKHMVLDDIANV